MAAKRVKRKRHKRSCQEIAWDKAEEAWKQACLRRDRFRCANCYSKEVLQVDHFIRRGHKSTFFDVRNGTTLCYICHQNKTWNNHGMEHTVGQIVEGREGHPAVVDLKSLSWQTKKWTIAELEEKAKELNSMFRDGV